MDPGTTEDPLHYEHPRRQGEEVLHCHSTGQMPEHHAERKYEKQGECILEKRQIPNNIYKGLQTLIDSWKIHKNLQEKAFIRPVEEGTKLFKDEFVLPFSRLSSPLIDINPQSSPYALPKLI